MWTVWWDIGCISPRRVHFNSLNCYTKKRNCIWVILRDDGYLFKSLKILCMGLESRFTIGFSIQEINMMTQFSLWGTLVLGGLNLRKWAPISWFRMPHMPTLIKKTMIIWCSRNTTEEVKSSQTFNLEKSCSNSKKPSQNKRNFS